MFKNLNSNYINSKINLLLCSRCLSCYDPWIICLKLKGSMMDGLIKASELFSIVKAIEICQYPRVNTYLLSPMTICEEFLWGITTVGDGKRLRKALGLYGSSGFLTIPAWWLSLTLWVSLNKHINFNWYLLSNRYELLSILLNCPCVRVAPEGHADRHAISHEDWAAWCDLGVCEAWTRLLYLVVMMNAHLLISV